MEISFTDSLASLLRDAASGEESRLLAARFHNTVAEAVVETVQRLHRETGLFDVVLTGGVFQNRYLLSRVGARLSDLGLEVHTNARVPANDGGLALGQAWLLRSFLRG
jgi:hydrogenase maturation protein HypF